MVTAIILAIICVMSAVLFHLSRIFHLQRQLDFEKRLNSELSVFVQEYIKTMTEEHIKEFTPRFQAALDRVAGRAKTSQ
jgi:hypothetical protein